MAFTTKLIIAHPDTLASDVKTYLDSVSPTTIHTITLAKSGTLIYCLIVFE